MQWLAYIPANPAPITAHEAGGTFLACRRAMPPPVTEWGTGGASYKLWPTQITAIENLQKSLAANKPKALIQMANGSGKAFASIGFIYRLIKFSDARRVLFLVSRGNLARQTKKEFDAYATLRIAMSNNTHAPNTMPQRWTVERSFVWQGRVAGCRNCERWRNTNCHFPA